MHLLRSIIAGLVFLLLPGMLCQGPVVSLTLSTATPAPNEPFTVSLAGANNPAHAQDWIGLYEAAVTPSGNPPAIWWEYLPKLGIRTGSGTFVFDPARIGTATRGRYRPGRMYKFVLVYDNGYRVEAHAPFRVTGDTTGLITSLRPAAVRTACGVPPRLPATVIAGFADGNERAVPVVWWTVPAGQYAGIGSFTVKGWVAGTELVPVVNVTVEDAAGPLLGFDVLSDLHLSGSNVQGNFRDALLDIRQYHPRADALCIVGDLTDNGSPEQYDTFRRILQSVPHAPAYMVPGNHDVRWLAGGFPEAKRRYLAGTGMPGLYHAKSIKGHLFVFLSTEKDLKDMADLSQTQLDWLEAALVKNAGSGRPAFVFLHQPLFETVPLTVTNDNDGYGGPKPENGIVQEARLRTILAKHPRVFFITGHTHMKVDSPDNLVRRGNCIMVNTGAVSYLWRVNGRNSQGLSFAVYPDRVLVQGRDFLRQEWVPGARWIVPCGAGR